MGFVYDVDHERRLNETAKIRLKYPDRVPCIIIKDKNCKNLPSLNKLKYLVPNTLTFGQMIFVIRRRIHLGPEKAIFLFVNNRLLSSSLLMSQVYHQHKALDGFIYITYSSENTFG